LICWAEPKSKMLSREPGVTKVDGEKRFRYVLDTALGRFNLLTLKTYALRRV